MASSAERAYCQAFAELIHVEAVLRFTFPRYTECARGDLAPCPEFAIVRCAVCGDEDLAT